MVEDLDRPVRLHQLTMLDEGDDVTVGRADIDAYCVLPADGAALLRELIRGTPPSRAAQWYERAFGQPVDIVEFLEAMTEMEFVAAPGEPVAAAGTVRSSRTSTASSRRRSRACSARRGPPTA